MKKPLRHLMIPTLVTALMVGGGLPGAVTFLPAQGTGTMATVPLPPHDPETELAEIHGRILNARTIELIGEIRPVPQRLGPNRIPAVDLRGDELERAARFIGAWSLLADEAREAGVSLNEEQIAEAEQMYARVASGELFEQVVRRNIPEAQEEELRRLYEERKEEAMIRINESLRLRQIYISTYVTHTVQEGETLESIALAISGDASLAPQILDDVTKLPRIQNATEAREGENLEIPARALEVGEILLVPGNAERVADARARANEAVELLRQGVDFLDVANQFSESERPTEVMTIEPHRRPFNEDLRAAFMALNDGEFSEPVRTRHGFHIIIRDGYTPAGHRSFEEVRATLANVYARDMTDRIVQRFFEDTSVDERFVTFHDETIAKEAGDLSGEDVLVTVGKQAFTRNDLFPSFDQSFEPVDAEAIAAVLRTTPAGQNALVESWRAATGFDESSFLKAAREMIRENLLTQTHLMNLAHETVPEPTDEEIAAFYEANIANYRIEGGFVLNRAFIRVPRGDEEAMQNAVERLRNRLSTVTNVHEFSNVADELNPVRPPQSPNRGAMGLVTFSRLMDAEREVIEQVEIPGMTDIIALDDMVYAFWVSSRRDESVRPLESVKDEIRNNLHNQARNAFIENAIEDAASRVEVTLLVD